MDTSSTHNPYWIPGEPELPGDPTLDQIAVLKVELRRKWDGNPRASDRGYAPGIRVIRTAELGLAPDALI